MPRSSEVHREALPLEVLLELVLVRVGRPDLVAVDDDDVHALGDGPAPRGGVVGLVAVERVEDAALRQHDQHRRAGPDVGVAG